MDTAALVPRMVRLDPPFAARTVNALASGAEVASSAMSNSAVSVAPFTVAPVICGGCTVTVTESGGLEDVPSFTVSENTRFVALGTPGGMNTGFAVRAPTSVTAGPPVCVHA